MRGFVGPIPLSALNNKLHTKHGEKAPRAQRGRNEMMSAGAVVIDNSRRTTVFLWRSLRHGAQPKGVCVPSRGAPRRIL